MYRCIVYTFCFRFNAAPSSPPTNVLAFAIDYDSIKILWQPPEASNQNGIIREYTVNLTETDTGTVYNLISFNNSVIAESLHANYNYSISVRAVTISPGPFSEPVFVLTNENGKINTLHAFYP